MKARLNRIIFKIHSYTGLITGIALLLIGFSGSLLVFSHEIEELVYEDILHCEVIGNRLSLDSALTITKSKFSEMDFVGFNTLPQKPTDTYQFFMVDDGVQYKAFLNPYTAEIIHSGKRYDHINDWLLIFHYTFTIPIWGDLAVALLAVTLFISLITGLVIYRKYIVKVFLFKVRLDFRNWRKGSSGLHRVIGVWSLLFLLMSTVTGFLMMKYAFTDTNFDRESWKFKSGPVYFSVDSLLADVQRNHPNYHPIGLFLPTMGDSTAYIAGYLNEPSFLFGDYNDQITWDGKKLRTNFVREKSNGEKFVGLLFPLHSGLYGNLLVKVVYCIGGLLPGLLSITGILLWWRRQKF
jgi:uncharacterized iron-regulated membrane protein